MPERSGRIVRPLLGMTRAETAAYCERARPAVARGHVERDLGARRDPRRSWRCALHPAAEHNVLRDAGGAARRGGGARRRGRRRAAAAARPATGGEAGTAARPVAGVDLSGLPPALARLVLQRLADEAAGGARTALAAHADAILALAARRAPRRSTSPAGCAPSPSTGGSGSTAASDAAARAGARSRCPAASRSARARSRASAARSRSPTARSPRPRSRRRSRSAPWRPGDRMRPLGPGRQQVAAGPVHRPQGPARAARAAARGASPTARSRGCRASRQGSASVSRTRPSHGCGWPGA